MDLRSLIPPALLGLGAAVLFGLDRLARWMQRRGWIDPGRDKIRRGTGHALLGLQEFIEPRAEYVAEAENREHREAEDADVGDGAGADPSIFLADLAAALAFSPVDAEEVRRHLA